MMRLALGKRLVQLLPSCARPQLLAAIALA
jgi:hypothetical protein